MIKPLKNVPDVLYLESSEDSDTDPVKLDLHDKSKVLKRDLGVKPFNQFIKAFKKIAVY